MQKYKIDNIIKIKIDFSSFECNEQTAKKIICKLKKARKWADLWKKRIEVEQLNQHSNNMDTIINPYEYCICIAIQIVQIENKVQRMEHLYDAICFYLDNVYKCQNLCDFRNDKCFVKKDTDVTMGCCHHYPNKKWGMFYQKKMVPCEFLGDKGCTTKSIGCKMFMCDEIKKKGYYFTLQNVLLIRYFFNWLQKLIIKTSVFESREDTIKKLLKFYF